MKTKITPRTICMWKAKIINQKSIQNKNRYEIHLNFKFSSFSLSSNVLSLFNVINYNNYIAFFNSKNFLLIT